MKRIVLRILREGPPHNQLLSPLTGYLAVVDGSPAVALRLTVEHHELRSWHTALRTLDLPSSVREATVSRARTEVTRLLASLPALAELYAPSAPVELVLETQAVELQLLPWELAHVPTGHPRAGQPLFVGPEAVVAFTRATGPRDSTVRRESPRVLVVGATGSGLPAVPLHAHALAVRRAIDPWVGWSDPRSVADLAQSQAHDGARRMRVVVDPTLQQLARAVETFQPTHVALLAHGVPQPGDPERFGIALGDGEVVDGDRLALVLARAKPNVVTLSVCEGANDSENVLSPGASVARALHEAGIPFVAASQFPMSFEGATRFADTFYQGVLQGEDPAEALDTARRDLRAHVADWHDWVSLCGYRAADIYAPDRMTARRMALDATVARLEALKGSGVTTGEAVRKLQVRLDAGVREWTQNHPEHERFLVSLLARVIDLRADPQSDAEALRAHMLEGPPDTDASAAPGWFGMSTRACWYDLRRRASRAGMRVTVLTADAVIANGVDELLRTLIEHELQVQGATNVWCRVETNALLLDAPENSESEDQRRLDEIRRAILEEPDPFVRFSLRRQVGRHQHWALVTGHRSEAKRLLLELHSELGRHGIPDWWGEGPVDP